jgi:hypothetical protein
MTEDKIQKGSETITNIYDELQVPGRKDTIYEILLKYLDGKIVVSEEKWQKIKTLVGTFPDTTRNLALVSIIIDIQKWFDELKKAVEE